MSDFMSWILSILGIVIIAAIFDIFLSEKKLGKLIRSVFASLIVLVIVTPLPMLFNSTGGCNFDANDIRLDEGYLSYTNQIKIQALENGLVDALSQNGCRGARVNVTAEVSGSTIVITIVRVDITKASFDKGGNIHSYMDVLEFASSSLNVPKDKIMIIE